jgi:GTPase SAR1 family protein
MIVFDVSSKDSFENIKACEKIFYQNTRNESFAFLVGNKIDLK